MITTHTIDATDKVLGRIAGQAAKILMGKTSTDYTANKVAQVNVEIVNASKTKMSIKRMEETIHERYSGYPGGFKTMTNAEILKKHGWKKLYELAVYGMLPSNKLRSQMMKRLKVTD